MSPAIRIPTDEQIQTAPVDLEEPIQAYRWLVGQVHQRDVRTDEEFQRRFNHFWRVRRNAQWRAAYYSLLERSKGAPVDFARTLTALHEATGTVEASFSSKLVATLDPTRPVLDAFVLKYFGLRLPYTYQSGRLGRTVDVYRRVAEGMDAIVRSPAMQKIRDAFTAHHPDAGLSDTKMVDFIVWRIRPEPPEPNGSGRGPTTAVDVGDAERSLLTLLDRVAGGESFVLTRAGEPLGLLTSVGRSKAKDKRDPAD